MKCKFIYFLLLIGITTSCGEISSILDKIEEVKCQVGGLPRPIEDPGG